MNKKIKPTIKKIEGYWVAKYTDEKGNCFEYQSKRSASHAINNWYLLYGEKLGALRGG